MLSWVSISSERRLVKLKIGHKALIGRIGASSTYFVHLFILTLTAIDLAFIKGLTKLKV